jgi:hypothetical protein
MKTFLPIIIFVIIAAVITACGSNPNIGSPRALPANSDTAGLAEFQQMKAYQASNTKTKTVYVVRNLRSAPERRSSEKYSNETSGAPAATTDYPGSTQPEATKKKGWSKAAKGAAIGAGSGAVIGAVVNKRNRVVGGVIGGAVGAGVGYGIGRHMDKKDGRY